MLRVGGLTDAEVLQPALDGSAAVISGVGARGCKDGPVAAGSTRSILAAMSAVGVRRLVAISARAGSADTRFECRQRVRTTPKARLTQRWPELCTDHLDAVVLANDYDAHAPLAIAFLEAGKHVLSESAACVDEAEGRALIAAADASDATYSLAENYVVHVRLIREALDAGTVGSVQLIESEYLHGMSPSTVQSLIGDPGTWRGRIAPTAYCTHTFSPVLHLTGAWPVEVTAFAVDNSDTRMAVAMVVRLSTGALAIGRHGFLQGESDSHWSWVGVRGSTGLIESVRATGEEAWSVRLRKESWTLDRDDPLEERGRARRVELNGSPVNRHCEGTVLMLQAFRDTVERGAEPLVSVRAAVAASLIGVAGAKSLKYHSIPVFVPDVSN